jgi:hypothetical protein
VAKAMTGFPLFFHLVHLFAERGQRRLAAAEESIEIERDGLDPVIVFGRVERGNEVLEFEFAGYVAGASNCRERIGSLSLLDQHAVEVHRQHAILDGRRPGRQYRIYQPKERQHEQQDQHVLDAHQQLPDGLHEPHFSLLRLASLLA